MSDMIEVNNGYKLIGVMKEQPKQLCFIAGRQGNKVTVLLVNGITTAEVEKYDNEFARVKTRTGLYNLMPCNKVVSMTDVADVCDIIRRSPYEG